MPAGSGFAKGPPFGSGYTTTTKYSGGPRSLTGQNNNYEASPDNSSRRGQGSGQRKLNNQQVSASGLGSLGSRELTELPIYQLLRAFNLQ